MQELLPAFADIHPTESRYARTVSFNEAVCGNLLCLHLRFDHVGLLLSNPTTHNTGTLPDPHFA